MTPCSNLISVQGGRTVFVLTTCKASVTVSLALRECERNEEEDGAWLCLLRSCLFIELLPACMLITSFPRLLAAIASNRQLLRRSSALEQLMLRGKILHRKNALSFTYLKAFKPYLSARSTTEQAHGLVVSHPRFFRVCRSKSLGG